MAHWSEAEANVARYMSSADPNAGYTVSFPADDTVQVDEHFDQSMNILGVFGVDSITAHGHGSARTVHGITQENALQVLNAGADSVAVIAGLLPDTPSAQGLRQRMEQWQQLVAL